MASEIIPGLWIGNFVDARNWKGNRLCVLERKEACEITDPTREDWVPILKPYYSHEYEIDADPKKLNEAADIIERRLKERKPLLVNCHQGIERSPLTLVWFLVKRRGMTVEEAYRFVQSKRGEVQDRRYWAQELLPHPYAKWHPLNEFGEEE